MRRFILCTLTIALTLSLALFAACNSDRQKNEEKAEQSDVLKMELLEPIVPLADGGAYAISNGEVWYLKGGEAIKVKKVEKFSAQLPKESKTLLNTKLEKSLWVLWRNEITNRQRQDQLAEGEPEPHDPRY
jgi:hypothetical protein